jgi:U3 small nucleolar RNA-associated protein 18
VDGKTNPKIQTVNFQNFPVKCARFSPNGKEFVVGSQNHPHLFVYDMMAGKIAKVRPGVTNSAPCSVKIFYFIVFF